MGSVLVVNWLGDHEVSWLPGLDTGHSSRVVVTSSERSVAVKEVGGPCLLELDDALIRGLDPVLAGTLDGLNEDFCGSAQGSGQGLDRLPEVKSRHS